MSFSSQAIFNSLCASPQSLSVGSVCASMSRPPSTKSGTGYSPPYPGESSLVIGSMLAVMRMNAEQVSIIAAREQTFSC